MSKKRKEQLQMMERIASGIELSQKATYDLSNSINSIINTKNETEMQLSEEDKLKAAYALNLCTVSVSQIVDYNDIYVLEQEYEAILNNLNLENIPKDDALLNILKQILDTITFFRIQEGEKALIEKEYQQKTKNAIWSSVPNLISIVASGDPVAIAVNLATQVGVGYMNYRKTKAENELSYERQNFQLQSSAIEQFNGLRRELFDTSWRLADTYGFNDEWRLTERQIKQYDQILMDDDYLRKYERLESIKDKFEAYPNFWYFLANAITNVIENKKKYYLTDSDCNVLSGKAKDNYYKYLNFAINNNVLREDQIASSCALEYIEYLDKSNDLSEIEKWISFAIEKSGNANDVLQLCAIKYLEIGDEKKAEKALRILVNEKFNQVMNAQILSKIYANRIDNDSQASVDYKLLASRINPEYLYPVGSSDTLKAFYSNQQSLLEDKFQEVINDKLRKKYNELFNSELPYSLPLKTLSRKKDIEDFIETIQDQQWIENAFGVVTLLFSSIIEMSFISDYEKGNLKNAVIRTILSRKEFIKDLIDSIYEGNTSKYSEITKKLNQFTFSALTGDLFESVETIFAKKIEQINRINENPIDMYLEIEYSLRELCSRENISFPEYINVVNTSTYFSSPYELDSWKLIGYDNTEQKELKSKIVQMLNVITSYEDMITDKNIWKLVCFDNPDSIKENQLLARIEMYNEKGKRIERKIIKLYDNFFTYRNKAYNYSDVRKYEKELNILLFNKKKFECDGINPDRLLDLFVQLSRLV